MVSAVDYLQAMRVRKQARRDMDAFLAKYDAVVAPTMSTGSRRVDELWDRPPVGAAPARAGNSQSLSLLPAGNLGGIPGLTVPNGFGQNNIPTGIQFVGSAWSEKTLIAIADAYQTRTGWHTRRPPAIS
jgi:aspartyl-tRNA(Asn)/glutamyl-tRNA(Gln) amidotransferase subunit A